MTRQLFEGDNSCTNSDLFVIMIKEHELVRRGCIEGNNQGNSCNGRRSSGYGG